MMKIFHNLLGLSVLFSAVSGFAADGPVLSVVPTEKVPALNGHVNPVEWDDCALRLENFQPSDRKFAPGVRRAAWLTFDQEKIYCAFRTTGRDVGKLTNPAEKRDDAVYIGESFELHLAHLQDPSSKVQLVVSPAAVVFDARNRNEDWNCSGNIAAGLNAEGWDLTMELKWSDLGLDPSSPDLSCLLVHNVCDSSGVISYVWGNSLSNFHAQNGYALLKQATTVAGAPNLLVVDEQKQPVLTVPLKNLSGEEQNITASVHFDRGGIIRDDFPDAIGSLHLGAGETGLLSITPALQLTEPVWGTLTMKDGAGEVFHRQKICFTYDPDFPVIVEVKNYLPSGQVGLRLSSRLAEKEDLQYKIFAPDNTLFASGSIAVPGNIDKQMYFVELPELVQEGCYRFECVGNNGMHYEANLFYQLPPEWISSPRGIDHELVAPYIPVVYQENTLSMLGGSYQFNTNALPVQVLAGESPILQQPIQFILKTQEREFELHEVALELKEQFPDQVILEGKKSFDTFSLTVTADVQEDAFLWYTFSIEPLDDKPLTIQSLKLLVPYRNDVADYLYPIDFSWENFARVLGEEAVWEGKFFPAITVYNDSCGMAFYAEAPRQWNSTAKPYSLVKNADGTLFTVDMIHQDTVLDKVSVFDFGFQLTPAKPVLAEERKFHPAHWIEYDEEKRAFTAPGAVTYHPGSGFDASSGRIALEAMRVDATGEGGMFSSDSHVFMFGNPAPLDGDTGILLLELPGKILAEVYWDNQIRSWTFKLNDGTVPAEVLPLELPQNQWFDLEFVWDEDSMELLVNGTVSARLNQPLSDFAFDNDSLLVSVGETRANYTSTVYVEDWSLESGSVSIAEKASECSAAKNTPRNGYCSGALTLCRIDGKVVWKLFGNFLTYRVNSGAKVMNFHQPWSKYYGSPVPPTDFFQRKLMELSTAVKAEGGILGVYCGGGLADTAPDSLYYKDYWMAEPDRRWAMDSASYVAPFTNYLDQAFSASCNGCSYWADYIAGGLAETMEKYNVGSLYYDGAIFGIACRNQAHGCGYYDRDNVLRESYCIRGIQRHGKQLYKLLKRKNPQGMIYNHYSGNLMPLAGAWSTLFLQGEEFMVCKPGTVVDLDEYRAKLYGRQFGAPAEMLIYHNQPFTLREGLTYSLLHDISPAAWTMIDLAQLSKIWDILDARNCGEAQWMPYWKNQHAVEVNPVAERIKLSFYLHHGKQVVAVVGNLTDAEESISFKLNADEIGFEPTAANITELEWGKALHAAADGTITITVPARDVKIIELLQK